MATYFALVTLDLHDTHKKSNTKEIRSGTGGVFAEVVHGVAISNAGLVYISDRQGDRVQVL